MRGVRRPSARHALGTLVVASASALASALALASGCGVPPAPTPAPVPTVSASSGPLASAPRAVVPAPSAPAASETPRPLATADYTFRVLAATDAVHEPEATQGEDQAGVADLGDKLLAYRGQQLWELAGGALAERNELLAGLPVRPEGREEMNIVGLYGSWPARAFLVTNVHGGNCATHAVYRWERTRWQRVVGPGTAAGLGDHPGLCKTFTDVSPWRDGALLASNNAAGKPEVFPRGPAPFDLAGLKKAPHFAEHRCDTLFALTSTASGHAFATGLRCAADGALRATALRWAPGAKKTTDEQALPVPTGAKELTILSMYAASEREVYAAGTADERGYLAVFDGAAWRMIDVPGARAITKVRGRPVWLVADGAVYVSELRRDPRGPSGAWSERTFAPIALPRDVPPTSFFDVLTRASGEVLLVGGPGILSGRPSSAPGLPR